METAIMNEANDTILAHNQAAAKMWGLGGKAYDNVSFAIADALKHGVQRLSAQPGESVLDIATGTGWSARNAARSGAGVTALDISSELLAAAKELSAHVQPPIEFVRGDAERLPFEDSRFDRIISTFGIMFAPKQAQAAEELTRVCKPGGRIVLVTWVPGGSVEEFFALVGKYSDGAPPEASPMVWGSPEEVTKLLGRDFELIFERGVNNAYHDSAQSIWDWYERGFGPMRALIETLDPARLEAFRKDVDAYHDHYLTDAGLLHVRRDYLVTIGRKR
ncbi:MAG TPA: methyltransferase domain-containing protein [Hyphomicrobiales bacterium]|nr:methyltransferase domain-containing protein [Hyphomicrobiales bacterium]